MIFPSGEVYNLWKILLNNGETWHKSREPEDLQGKGQVVHLPEGLRNPQQENSSNVTTKKTVVKTENVQPEAILKIRVLKKNFSRLPAAAAEKAAKYLLSRAATSRYTAMIALSLKIAETMVTEAAAEDRNLLRGNWNR